MSRIIVLGATGRTGQEIVRQALAGGHDVTALVRRPEALPIRDERLEVVVGDATDRDVIARIVDGADALIASLGRPESNTTKDSIDDTQDVDVCFVSTRHILDLSREGIGPRTALFMSTHGAGSSNDGSEYSENLRDMVGRRVADKDDMERLLAETDAPLTWTVVRNPLIYDGPSASPSVYSRIELDATSKVTYGDLAAFALSEVLSPDHAGVFLTITEPLTGPAADRPSELAGSAVRSYAG